MIRNNKGRNRWHGATPKALERHDHTFIRSSIKAAIVCLALNGVIPPSLATWLIQRGGLKHV